MTEQAQLSAHRKRRGVVRASLTRLQTRVSDIERAIEQPGTLDAARQLLTKLESLDADFRMHHLAIVDLTDDEDALVTEQDALDAHDDDVSRIGLRLRKVISTCTTSTDVSRHKILFKRLSRLETMLASITTDLLSLPSGSDEVIMLHQFEEQLTEHKRELTDVRNLLYTLDLEDSDNLNILHAAVEKTLFDLSLNIKKHLSHHYDDTSTDS